MTASIADAEFGKRRCAGLIASPKIMLRPCLLALALLAPFLAKPAVAFEYKSSISHEYSDSNISIPSGEVSDTWNTGFTITNTRNIPANVSIKATDDNGNVISVKELYLKENASYSNNFDTFFGDQGSFSVEITSDGPIAAQGKSFFIEYPSMRDLYSLSFKYEEGGEKLIFPHLASEHIEYAGGVTNWYTGVAIENKGEKSTRVELIPRDTNGNQIAPSYIEEIPAHSKMKAKLVRTLFNNNSPLNKSGYLEAISLDGEPIKGYLLYTWEGKGLFALDGVSEKELSTELFQRFSSKNNLQGQPSSYTGCGVSNPNNTPVNFLLQFFNLQGDFIDSVQKTIPAHSQLPPETIRDLCPSAEGLEGLIRIKSDSPITGMVCRLVGADSDSGGKVDGANFDGNPSYTLNFPKVVKGKHPYTILAPEVSSTLYIINTEEKSAKVRIIQYDKDGTTEKIIDNSLSGLETIVVNSSDLKIDDGFVKVESNRKLIGGQEITDKDYTVFAYSPAIKTPAVGILEDLVREAPLASADVYFQDKAGNLISSSKGKPEFLIPENTERIRLIKNGFYTHETDVSTYDTPDYIYKLITNDTNLFDMDIYDGSWRTDDEKEMHKWCAGDLKGVYVDISTTHAPSLSSIPQEWINIELDAINKVKEVYPELFLNAQVVVGKNPPLHKNELTGYTRIDRGWFWGYWDDSAEYSAYHYETGDNIYESYPQKGEKIISGGNQLGTKTFYLPRTYLIEIAQCLLGAMDDILTYKESLFSDRYSLSENDFSYYDLQCIKLMRNRPVGHTTANVPAIGSSRESLNLTIIKDYNPPRN